MSGAYRLRRVGAAWIAENAVVTGDVELGEDANVWFGVTIRGDVAPIRIGARTNVQDGTVVHVDPDCPNVIGNGVTIGHGAICHGILVQDGALVGMGAILLSGSVIGEHAVVGAGAVVSEGMEIPPFSLAVGVPARVVKTYAEDARRAEAAWMANGYVEQSRRTAAGEAPAPLPPRP